MRIVLLFLLRLLVISVVLFALHKWVMITYEFILLMALSTITPAWQTSVLSYYDSSYRLIPFLALLLATPGLGLKRRLTGLAVGLSVFWGMDFVSTLLWIAPPSPVLGHGAPSKAHLLYSLVWNLLGQWVLPFVLWIWTARTQIKSLFHVPAGKDQERVKKAFS